LVYVLAASTKTQTVVSSSTPAPSNGVALKVFGSALEAAPKPKDNDLKAYFMYLFQNNYDREFPSVDHRAVITKEVKIILSSPGGSGNGGAVLLGQFVPDVTMPGEMPGQNHWGLSTIKMNMQNEPMAELFRALCSKPKGTVLKLIDGPRIYFMLAEGQLWWHC
jgi:hypothetical protein